MRRLSLLAAAGAATLFLSLGATPDSAQARCKTFHASHNGTDFFYRDGTEGTVKNKLIWYVEQWQKKNNIKRVRYGRFHIKCGDWFIKYMLPHRNCKAKSTVCY